MSIRNTDFGIVAILFFGVFLSSVLSAQEELTFVAERDAVVFSLNKNETIVLNIDDVITTSAGVGYGETPQNPLEYHLLIFFERSGNRYEALAKDFRPANTDDVFGDDIFIDQPMDRQAVGHWQLSGLSIDIGDVDAMWVPVCYRDILISEDRDKLLEFFPNIAFLTDNDATGRISYWHQNTRAGIQNGRIIFYNSVISLGIGTHLAVRNITRTDFGYVVECVASTRDWRHDPVEFLAGSTFRNVYSPGDSLTLLLYLDGDYLDVYTGSDIHIGTFIRVGREFIAQYQSLIRTNTADLTNVLWPRRADGTMSLPLYTDMSGFQANHMTTSRLRVRDNPATDSLIMTTLDTGIEIQVLETGSVETIGGTTAPWVRVLTANGFTGWVFSGFLEPIAAEPEAPYPVIAEAPEEQPAPIALAAPTGQPMPVAESNAIVNPMPPWALLALVGVAAVAIVALTLIVAKRKR